MTERNIFSEMDDAEKFAMGMNDRGSIRGTLRAIREIIPLPRKTRSWEETGSRRDVIAETLDLEDNPQI